MEFPEFFRSQIQNNIHNSTVWDNGAYNRVLYDFSKRYYIFSWYDPTVLFLYAKRRKQKYSYTYSVK